MKRIKLKKDVYALVDNEDYDFLNQWKWHLSDSGYAVRCRSKEERKDGGTKFIRMHRVINNTTSWKQTDHKDGNGLNNVKSNLRSATASQNGANQIPQVGRSSAYKGVYWDKANQKWRAKIKLNQKSMCLGRYICEREAAIAYNKRAIELYGEFAQTNEVLL